MIADVTGVRIHVIGALLSVAGLATCLGQVLSTRSSLNGNEAPATSPSRTVHRRGSVPVRSRVGRVPVPRFVSTAPSSAEPVPTDESGPLAADPLAEVLLALDIPAEQRQPVRDILRLSRERFRELLADRTGVDHAEFATIVKTVVTEKDDNLRAVIGADKVEEWRAYRRRDRSAPK